MILARQLMPMHSTDRNRIYVYRGEGAGWRSVSSTAESLQRLLPDCYQVSTLTATELLSGAWAEQAAMLVMPGGADLPYCKHLNGHGNALIRRFVHSGGSYLGLCAGAYYAAARVEFEPGSPLEVVGDRELAFFPGTARGAAYPGFDYQTESGAVAAGLQFAVPPQLVGQQQQEASITQQLMPNVPAHGLCDSGSTWQHTYDYCNGGPYFVTCQGQHDLSAIPGVEVLGTYAALPHRDMQPQHQQCTGQAFNSISTQRQQQQHPQQASIQHELPAVDQQASVWQAAAAVRCSVGLGVAVLCGTHPELEPHWLDVCGRSLERAAAANELSTGAAQQRSAVAAARQATSDEASCGHAAAVRSGAVVSSNTQLGVEQSAAAWAANGASSSLSQSGSMQSCKDAQLALHTETLRSTLAACQQQRDLFLSCLLYKALWRP